MKKRKFLSAALSVILSLSMCLSACATPSDDDDDINEDQGTHQPPSGDDDQGGNTPVDPGDDDQGGNTPVDPGDDDQGGDEPGDVHVHDYVWHHTAQKHWQECLGCDDVTAEQDHAWSAWTTIKDPTCTEEGIRTRECTVCGYEAEESISVLAHSWADEYESDANGHWHQCKNCTATSTVESHKYGAWTVTEATLTSPGARQHTCEVCGYVQKETIPQHELSDAWEYDATSHYNAEVTKQPTCTAEGEKTYTCKCGATKTESIPATNHVWGEEYKSDANGHWHQCKNCTATSTAESHKYGAWTVTEATLTSPGTRQHTCEVCGYVQKETIPQHELSDAWEYDATSHSPHNGTWQVVKPATCTEAGTEKYTCECGYTQERTVPATNHVWGEEYGSDANGHWHVCTAEDCGATSAVESHNWGEWQVVNPATETEQGLRKRSCTLCGYEVTESIPVLGHTHDIDETKWASDAGYHWHACSGCDERVNEAVHGWDKGAVTKQPTCTEEGVMTYKCTVCGYEKTEAIEKIAHDYAEVWSKNETNHWHECTVCGDKADLSAHAWGSGAVTRPATCTEAGEETYTCECGATKTEAIAAAGHKYATVWSKDETNHWHECTVCGDKKDQAAHDWDEGVVTKQPTCTEEGVKTYTCECGATKTEAIAAAGHKYSAEWSKDETNHWHECTVCHAKTDIAGHAWGSGVVTRPATCTEDGEKTYTCECGATKTEAIAAAGHKYATEWSKDETNHWHECTVCHAKTDIAGHAWGSGVVTKQPTCTEDGERTYTCECGATRTEAIAAAGHTPETAWTTDETNHWHVCSVCGAIDEDSKSAHTYGEWVTEEKPTATEEGLKVQTCSVCGHRHEETIPATGQPEHTHSWATGWSSDATSHWHACTVDGCAEKSDIAAHDAGIWVTVTEAQIGKDGLSELQCTVCHYVLDSKVIPALPVEPVEGAVQITLAAGDLESAYVEWNELEGADWYNVYYQKSGATDWTQLDQPLVRKYSGESGNYFRADAIGLSAGQYLIKVAAVDETGAEIASSASTTAALTVKAHERYGYAFVNGTSSGAYNEDGTLKANAVVLYITPANKDSISLEVTGATSNPCVGLQNIISGFKKGKDNRPLCVRFVGNITDFAVMDKGDIVIDGCSNGITFEGIGKDATANGWGLRIKNSSNVEVRNLGFMNCDSSEGDNIGLQQNNDHVWVHNCDLFYGHAGSDADQVKGDGALDTKTSTYVTHSYNHFWDSGKCNLQGMKSETTSNYITYHHNWYDHSDSRHPRIRTCTVHIFNNYFDGNAKYGVGVTMGASAFVENNYFRSEADQKPMMSSMQGTDIAGGEGTFSGEDGGIIKSYGNTFAGSGTVHLVTWQQDNTEFDVYEATSRDEPVPSSVKTKQGGTTYNNFDTASDFYEYEVDTAEEAKAKVEQYAGRVQGGDFKWEFDDATEDGNYAVIPELKQAITNYESSLLEVRGAGASVVNPGGGDEPGGGEQGGEDQPGGGSIVEGSTLITFEMGGAYSNTVVSGVTITGNPSDSKGSMNVGGTTYNVCLKMESSTKISFTPGEDMTMTLYLDAPGKSITINGEKMTVGSDGTVTVELAAGTAYTITKGDSMNLYAIVLSPLGGDTPGPDTHEHVWAEEWSHNSLTHWHACTVNGCTEKGAEAEHTYSNGKCTECGYEQPSQTVAVTGVTLNRTSATLTVGDSITLTATVAPDNATEKSVSWQSGNSAVASVDQSGKVTALKAGTAVITVTTLDGSKTASCTVTVEAEEEPDAPQGSTVTTNFDYAGFAAQAPGCTSSSNKTTVPITVDNFTVDAGVYHSGDMLNTQGMNITVVLSGDENGISFTAVSGSSTKQVFVTINNAEGTAVYPRTELSGSATLVSVDKLPAGTYTIVSENSIKITNLKVTESYAPHECTPVLVKQAVEATCTAEGNIAYWQCTDPDCGKYYSDAEGKTQITLAETVIPAKGHAKSAAWSYDVSGHWHACLNDGCAEKLEFAAHDTAGANGTCSVCGYKEGHTHSASKVAIQGACQGAVLTEYYLCDGCGAMFRDEACTQALSADDVAAMSAHTLEHHAAVVPGCTQPGNREYWHCTACGNYYSDSAAQNQTSLVDLEIAANGHTFANYVSTATEHYKTCSVCGAVDQSTRGDHTFVDAGGNKQECSVCHYEIDLAAIQNIDSYGAYNESMYVVLKTDNAAGITASYNVSGDATSYSVPQEQIRVVDGKVRIDVVGVSAGTYDMSIGLGSVTVPVEGIQVEAYDRTGYAHFGYDKGIGAYDNDGTLKDGALVIYLTDENKNDITNSAYVYDEATNSYAKVSASDMQKYFHTSGTSYSIGYFLNNRNYTTGEGRLGGGIDNYGLKAACDDYGSVAIRVIGSVNAEDASDGAVSLIDGLTAYNSTANAGTVGDNGRMARIVNAYNLTIEGIGEDAEIYGWGVHFIAGDKGVGTDGTAWGESFEVRNITFDHYPEDAIGMEGQQEGSVITVPVQRCWVHNNVFMPGYCGKPAESDKAEGDGSCDFKRGEYFTFDYNYLYGCHKTNLVGSSDSSLQYNLTYHHNWWHNCGSRIPLTRQANVHFYNNYISVDANYDGEISYVMSPRANCYIFAEGNYFDGCKNIISGSGGTVKFYNNTFYACYDDIPSQTATRDEKVSSNCAYNGVSYSSFETNSSLFYDAEGLLATDSATARKVVMENAGVNGFGYETAPGMNEVTPESALSIPEGGLNIDLSQVGKSTTVQYVNGVAFTNITGTSSGTVKGKGQLATFTISGGAVVTISCSGSGAAAGELIGADGTLYAGKINGTVTVELGSGTYVLASGIKDKELTINSISFEDTAASSQIRIDAAIEAINAIHGTVTLADAEAVSAARFAYDALREDEAAQLDGSLVAKLEAAEATLNTLQVNNVISLIDAIGTVTADSYDAISAARSAYNALPVALRGQISNYAVLTAAEAAFESFEVTNVIKMIEVLVTTDKIDVTNEAAVQQAYDAYSAAYDAYRLLDSNQQSEVDGAYYDKVVNGTEYLADVLAVYDFKVKLANVSVDSGMIELNAVIAAYGKLNASVAAQVLTDEEQAKYQSIVGKYEEEAAKSVTISFTEGADNYYANVPTVTVGSEISYKSGAARVIDGVTYDGIKVNTALRITFTIAADMDITIYFGEGQKGSVYIDAGPSRTEANSCDLVNGQVVTTLKAGTYTISKHDTETTMFLIQLSPAV